MLWTLEQMTAFFRTVLVGIVCLIGISHAQSQVASQIGPNTYEYWADNESAQSKHFSFALLHLLRLRTPDGRARVVPKFSLSDDFRYVAEIPIPDGTDLYGTGEVAGPLRRNGRITECWNTDQFNYSEKSPSLYQSHPWVLAVRRDGTSFGVLADTTYRCRIDLTTDIKFAANGPKFPVIVIEEKSPQLVVQKLADLTGHMPLPPEWALGYHQCRWSYMSSIEALGVAKQFREKHIPCDTIWFDIDYMNGFRVFTFNPKTFPDPKDTNDQLAKLGFHNVWMIDPGVKVDEHYATYLSGKSKDVFVKTPMGFDQTGNVWPGQCVFPDFTRPETRSWWSDQYRDWSANGIDGVWNDMNEPSFFGVPTKTMPEEAWHRGGHEIAPGPHAQYHNVFGMLMARATREGLLKANPNKRPFILTRAGYIGYQRYAATWTGDNASTWTDMQNAIPMVLNLGLSGQPFVGPDIPGFSNQGPSNPEERIEFFSKWWGLGSLLPFSRGHAMKGMERKEPWAFGPDVEEASRRALWRRYVLLPYLYTTFYQSSKTGLPVARPLFFADPVDPKLRTENHGFLLGDDIAVKAQVQPGVADVAMPKGWEPLSLDADQKYLPSLYIRPGAIAPLGSPREFVGQKVDETIWLVVNLDVKERASGTLYEDAGDGFSNEHGDFLLTTYKAGRVSNRVKVWIAKTEGIRKRPNRNVIVVILQDGTWLAQSSPVQDGQTATLLLPEKSVPVPKTIGPTYAGA